MTIYKKLFEIFDILRDLDELRISRGLPKDRKHTKIPWLMSKTEQAIIIKHFGDNDIDT